jgi:predicted DNA-binding protein
MRQRIERVESESGDARAELRRLFAIASSGGGGCRLLIYMAQTTTIRVSIQTRNRLNSLASRRGEPAGEVVAKLVNAADEKTLLAEAEAAFEALADDRDALAAYRSEAGELEAGFQAPSPTW